MRLIRRQMMGEDLDAPGGPGGPVAEMAPNTQKSAGVHTIEAVAANEDNEGHVQVKAPPKHGGRRQPKGGEAGADASGPGRPAEDEEIMLLKGWNGKLIAERLGLPGLEIEIERAVEQVENDLKKGDELHEEKKEIEKAARTPQGQSK